ANDIPGVEHLNNISLPENYVHKYYQYQMLTWPHASYIAQELSNSKIVGYVLAKM
ncbi:MAG: N-terminal acetyltransferase A complex catalytic subunit ard1, partial [Paramarteilia canceri]